MGHAFSAGNEAAVDHVHTSAPIVAQNALLNTFCGDSCHIESKTMNLSNGYINYIEVVSKDKKAKNDLLISNTASSSSMAVATTTKKQNADEKVLVLTHGYGSGIGFFYPNFSKLAGMFDRVIAFDWLGMGSSCRYPTGKGTIPMKGWLNANTMTPTKASDFFVDNLEEFRQELGLTNFVLAGHSLGGYLAGRYAYKYPDYLKGLVMISPAGIPPLPRPETHVKPIDLGLKLQGIQTAWANNFTPQMYVRMMPAAKAEKTVVSTLERRFGPNKFSSEQLSLLSRYLYTITSAPACGEYALASILTPIISYKVFPPPPVTVAADKNPSASGRSGMFPPNTKVGVYAHEPLHDLFAVKCAIPSMLIMYGDTDWLSYDQIGDTMEKWRKMNKTTHKHDLDVSCVTIPNAGHHIYLDNPDGFHKEMEKFKKKVYKV